MAGIAAQEERDEEDLEVIVEGEDDPKDEGEREPDDEDEERSSADEGDDDEHDDRRRERREKRKQQKAKRREFQERDRQTIEFLTRQVQELSARVGAAEGGIAGGQQARVEGAIRETDSAIAALRQAKKQAVTDLDGERVDQIDEQLYTLRRRKEDLEELKKQSAQPPRRPTTDMPAQQEMARWAARNAWFNPDPRAADEDSEIARGVDKVLAREGRYTVGSPEYFAELDKRLAKRLPHRYGENEDDDVTTRQEQRPARRPPTQGSGRGNPNGAKTYVISKARHEAAMQAGAADDPERMKRLAKYFKKFDAENGRR